MRIVSYRSEGGLRAGIEHNGLVYDVTPSTTSAGVSPVRALIAGGSAAIEAAMARANQAFESHDPGLLSLDALYLGPPIPDP